MKPPKILEHQIWQWIDSGEVDGVALAIIDFSSNTYQWKEFAKNEKNYLYDLASLTKPLTNSLLLWQKQIPLECAYWQDLLNHCAGFPTWAILDQRNWKEQLWKFSIRKSQTQYSDLSSLRLMLEIEKYYQRPFEQLVRDYLPLSIYHWTQLPPDGFYLQNGEVHGKPRIGVVHDPNAYNIKSFLSHAGLFSTIFDLAKFLCDFNQSHSFVKFMHHWLADLKDQKRYVWGFDTPQDLQQTLAGPGCSPLTFGHLGFTGTSFWIDTDKKFGQIMLSNATKKYWHSKRTREHLNFLRRQWGEWVWSSR